MPRYYTKSKLPRSLITRAGTPPTTARSATSLVTTAFAPTDYRM
jgi:hypothetical protein